MEAHTEALDFWRGGNLALYNEEKTQTLLYPAHSIRMSIHAENFFLCAPLMYSSTTYVCSFEFDLPGPVLSSHMQTTPVRTPGSCQASFSSLSSQESANGRKTLLRDSKCQLTCVSSPTARLRVYKKRCECSRYLVSVNRSNARGVRFETKPYSTQRARSPDNHAWP